MPVSGSTIDNEPIGVTYHWAPTSRRKGIIRYGLRPGMWSVDRLWKPPFVCLSDDPWLAWELSGRVHPEIKEWDLWAVFPTGFDMAERIYERFRDGSGHYIKEYRVYKRIYKRDIWYVATRQS